MPANLVRCASCRALLNPELSPREILAPEFVPLQEVEAVIDTPIVGYFVTCPKCQKELRIHARYDGQHVACKFCNGQFPFKLQPLSVQVPAFYADCPHCKKELRAARKYSDAKVECKFCNGSIHFV